MEYHWLVLHLNEAAFAYKVVLVLSEVLHPYRHWYCTINGLIFTLLLQYQAQALALEGMDYSFGIPQPNRPVFKLLQTAGMLRTMLVQCHEVGLTTVMPTPSQLSRHNAH